MKPRVVAVVDEEGPIVCDSQDQLIDLLESDVYGFVLSPTLTEIGFYDCKKEAAVDAVLVALESNYGIEQLALCKCYNNHNNQQHIHPSSSSSSSITRFHSFC